MRARPKIPMVAHTISVVLAKEFVKESLTARSLVTPAQAGVHPPTARTQRSLGQALQLLETPGAAEPWGSAFPTEQSPWAEGPREDGTLVAFGTSIAISYRGKGAGAECAE